MYNLNKVINNTNTIRRYIHHDFAVPAGRVIRKRLRKKTSMLESRVDVNHFELPPCDAFPNKMVLNVNVFRVRVVAGLLVR